MSNVKEDIDLIRRFLEGEEEAFNALVRKYRQRVYYLAYRFTHNHHDADELSQESFIKAYSSLKKFKGKSSFFTWLYRIVVNTCINYLSRRSRVVQTPLEHFPLSHKGPDALSVLESKELRAVIEAAIGRLPVQQRAAFILRQKEELTFKEVSESMGCSVGAAKASYFQAVRKLRRYLKESGI